MPSTDPPDDPDFLYRYVGISGDRAEYLRDTIQSNRLFLSSPAGFNDPFDCRVAFSFDGSDLQWDRYFDECLRRRASHLTPAEHARRVAEFVAQARYRDPEYQRRFIEQLQGDVDRAGVACFSAVPDDLLMWAHYAEKHHGVCLKFVGRRYEPVIGEAQPVVYSPEFRVARVWDPPMTSMEYAILTKSDHWKYEREWRLFKPQHAGKYLPFDPRSLVAIVFGCRTPKNDRRQIQRWLAKRGGPPVAVLEAKRVDGAFALKIVSVSANPRRGGPPTARTVDSRPSQSRRPPRPAFFSDPDTEG